MCQFKAYMFMSIIASFSSKVYQIFDNDEAVNSMAKKVAYLFWSNRGMTVDISTPVLLSVDHCNL